ncbi:hypothetical protein Goshw_014414 [Gossypium schwendimanii]|uniref:Anther-specific protein BCP1 n=4 Tax=Gossypium TaxID=3633 RepID=A0A7J9N053_GOSSC|nr:hypothetical protein [Gossypium lobatum]MBA0682504.1 hypothetical protein [Gossypium aridum]MBA0730329.1 hypothetical protein [Gossypium laxum]MBA0876733.1 hypothetical protein [Gossypium schwendimanii]
MARQSFVLALVFIALVGLVSAANTASKAPSAVPVPDDDAIGNTDDGAGASSPGASNDAVAAPLGSEQEAKSMAPAPSSDATTTGVSAVGAAALTGAAAIATYFVF